MATLQLCIALKDHPQQEMMRLMIMNKIRMLKRAVEETGYDIENVIFKEMCNRSR